MKGCLKHLQLALDGAQPPTSPRKTVVFESTSLETVFLADEWDRTPMEPARKLSYQDLLELKEIQRSLPRANQPADALSGRSGSHYLSNVPIGLLPLLPDTPTTSEATPSPKSPRPKTTSSPMSPSWASFSPNSRTCPMPTSPPLGGVDAVLHPSNLAHLPPAAPQAPKPKPRFAFLPLLDNAPDSRSRSPSPDPSDTDPPTPSLTNASLDSSPLSRASSCSPEPPFFQLPPPRNRPGFHDSHYGDDQLSDTDGNPLLSSKLGSMHLKSPPVPPYGFNRPALTRFVPPPPPPPLAQKKKASRNVIVVNGIEIDLDDDDDEEDSVTPPGSQPRSPPSSRAPSIPQSPPPQPQTQKPVLRWQSPPNTASPCNSEPSQFSGLHAPIRFKRQTPSTKGDCSSPISSSPISTSPPSPRGRRGSCSSKARPHVSSPRSSPILMPRA